MTGILFRGIVRCIGAQSRHRQFSGGSLCNMPSLTRVSCYLPEDDVIQTAGNVKTGFACPTGNLDQRRSLCN